MSAVYLGLVLVPLFALAWNLLPAEHRPRLRGGRGVTRAVGSAGRSVRRSFARLRRRPKGGLGLAPDVPRSPSVAGWVPAPGYSAFPVSDTDEATAA